MGIQIPSRKGAQQPPHFRLTLLWHGRPSQQLLSSCLILGEVSYWKTSHVHFKSSVVYHCVPLPRSADLLTSNIRSRYKVITVVITFGVSRIYDAKCIVVTRVCVPVCLCVCLSVRGRMPTLFCTDPDVTWRSGRGCPLVVHYWEDLQSVHGLRCYGNITRTRNVSEYVLVLALCLVMWCDLAVDGGD